MCTKFVHLGILTLLPGKNKLLLVSNRSNIHVSTVEMKLDVGQFKTAFSSTSLLVFLSVQLYMACIA